MDIQTYIQSNFDFDRKLIELCFEAEKKLGRQFKAIDDTAEINQYKILLSMQSNQLSEIHFARTTGYGYNDIGRETVEKIYASVFHTENALVRPQLVSGTHAICVALFGNLRPGDEMLSPAGKLYDTMDKVIGFHNERGSLKDYSIQYKQVDLLEDGSFDYDGIERAVNKKTKLVMIQRSKGYSLRKSFSVMEIKNLIAFIKEINKNIICMVDNCYGEFTEIAEPPDGGADLTVGSLIKNPGGGLAPAGGYIVGKEEFIQNAAFRLTAPGLGKDIGATLGLNQPFLQGLFLAPHVVAQSLKGAVFAAKVLEDLGFSVFPRYDEIRADIVQAVSLCNEKNVISFCQGIQKGSPVDSFVTPEPSDMPGYLHPVIMAAGAFHQGSSIELSADAPIKEPYTVFLQGGLTYHHAKIGIMTGIHHMLNNMK